MRESKMFHVLGVLRNKPLVAKKHRSKGLAPNLA